MFRNIICLYFVLFLNIIVTVSLAENIDQVCEQKCNVTHEEVKNLQPEDNQTHEVTVLCFNKCHLIIRGYIKEDGTIMANLIMDELKHVKEPEKIEKCLNKLEKISSYQDVSKLFECTTT